jgi:hypothetical protein
LDRAVALRSDDPATALAEAQQADQLAEQASRTAHSDVDQWSTYRAGGTGGFAGGGGSAVDGLAGAVLGGILVGGARGHRYGGDHGRGFGGGFGADLVAGSAEVGAAEVAGSADIRLVALAVAVAAQDASDPPGVAFNRGMNPSRCGVIRVAAQRCAR